MNALRRWTAVVVVATGAVWIGAGCSTRTSTSTTSTPSAEEQQVAANLANFDDLDFNVFTNQKWDELHKSHSDSITVHWPDGQRTPTIAHYANAFEAVGVVF